MINRNTKYSLDLNFCTGDNYHLLKTIPILKEYSIPRNIIALSYSIDGFIKKAIDLEYFVYFSVDVYEIEAYTGWYHNIHMNHDLMVIGYDENEFYIADFFGMKYSVKKCLIEQLIAGYTGFDEKRGNSGFADIYLLQTDKDYIHTFDVKFAKLLIKEYYEGVNSNIHFRPVRNSIILNEELYAFGMDIYPVLKEYIRNAKGCELRIRSFHILYEHKKMILYLLEYLTDINLLENSDVHISRAEIILDIAKLIRNMVIKYNLKNETELMGEIITMIEKIEKCETELLERLVNDIRDVPRNYICENVRSSCSGRSITYIGEWLRDKDGTMYSNSEKSSLGYIFKGTEVEVSLRSTDYRRKVNIVCDGKEIEYCLEPQTNNIIVKNLKYGYHYLTVYNNNRDIKVLDIECKTNDMCITPGYTICEYKGIDLATEGHWKCRYGTNGYDIYGYKQKLKYYSKLVYVGFSDKIWNLSEENDKGQALETDEKGKIAACRFFGKEASIDIIMAGEQQKKISFYIMDCYGFERKMKIRVVDADNDNMLDERTVGVISAIFID